MVHYGQRHGHSRLIYNYHYKSQTRLKYLIFKEFCRWKSRIMDHKYSKSHVTADIVFPNHGWIILYFRITPSISAKSQITQNSFQTLIVALCPTSLLTLTLCNILSNKGFLLIWKIENKLNQIASNKISITILSFATKLAMQSFV